MPTKGLHMSDPAAKAIEDIAWTNRMDVSPILRAALHYYLSENPDGLEIPEDDLEILTGEGDE